MSKSKVTDEMLLLAKTELLEGGLTDIALRCALEAVLAVADRGDKLTAVERCIVETTRIGEPSPEQISWLRSIIDRLAPKPGTP